MQRITYSIMAVLLLLFVAAPPLVAQEEATEEASNPLAGYTLGLNVGYPVLHGKTYDSGTGPVIGLVGNTPYGFPLGPFNIGVGFDFEATLMDRGTEIGIIGTINTTIYTSPYGPLSFWGGAGYNKGFGTIGGIYFDYMIPNQPIVVKPYLRGTIKTKTEGPGTTTGYATLGMMITYDISTLF